MNSFFDQIFEEARNDLHIDFPSPQILVVSGPVSSPARFPCTSIIEMSNTPHQRTFDTAGVEHHSRVMIQVEAFSNTSPTPQRPVTAMMEVRQIIQVIDPIMMKYKFVRTFCQPIPNFDSTVARMLARYEVVFGRNGHTYRN